MGRLLFIKLSLLLLILINKNILAEKIHLKNGQVIKGKIISETADFIRIRVSVGETKLDKKQIIKVESDAALKENKSKVYTLQELLTSANDEISRGNRHEGIIYLKKAWEKTGRTDQSIRERFWKEEKAFAEESLNRVNTLIEERKFKTAAQDIENFLRIFRSRPKIESTLKKLRNDVYKNFLSDEETAEYFDAVLERWDFFTIAIDSKSSSKQKPVKRKSRRKKNKKSKKGEGDTSYDGFSKKMELVDPVYDKVVAAITPLYGFYKFIIENDFDLYASRSLYSKKAIDAARGDRNKFRSICAENDKIYKSRSACKQFNISLHNARKELDSVTEKVADENEKWRSQGYEKVGNEWLTGNDLKKAKGLVYYHGQWLDPGDKDFDQQMADIDAKLQETIRKAQEAEKIIQEEQEKLKQEALKESKQEQQEDPLDEIENQQKKLSESIQKAFKTEEKKETMQQEKVLAEKTETTDAESSLPVEEEAAKGLPTPVGVGILAFLGLILYFNKRGSKK